MKLAHPQQSLPDGGVVPAHEVEVVCSYCGYDVNTAELEAKTCTNCGQPLKLKQSVAIQVTAPPPLFGGVM